MELLVALAFTGAVIGLAGRLPSRQVVKRELASARIQSIESLVENTAVAVRGTIVALDGGSVAPISGSACVYWVVTFDEVGAGGDYRELGFVEGGTPFLLESATGTARVVPDRPRIAVPGVSTNVPMRSLDDPRANHPGVRMARSACKRPNYPKSSTLRITEYVVTAGMVVTVKGFCTREPDPSVPVSGYRGTPPSRPVISGTRRVRMLIG